MVWRDRRTIATRRFLSVRGSEIRNVRNLFHSGCQFILKISLIFSSLAHVYGRIQFFSLPPFSLSLSLESSVFSPFSSTLFIWYLWVYWILDEFVVSVQYLFNGHWALGILILNKFLKVAFERHDNYGRWQKPVRRLVLSKCDATNKLLRIIFCACTLSTLRYRRLCGAGSDTHRNNDKVIAVAILRSGQIGRIRS